MASYNKFINTVAQIEGGFQKIPSDRGNYNSRNELVGTNHGISAPVYEKWIGYVPSEISMRNITKTIATEIFKANYWNRLSASYINSQAIAETLVDHGVNAGTGAAAKVMQSVLNKNFNFNLAVDGAIGTLSIEAINSVSPILLFQEFSAGRIEDYKTKKNADLDFWLPKWIERVSIFSDKFGIELKKKA